ncbi:class I SAM-dependent methyltransferase [Natronorarus salvus]|uniref:class I SAM-dependent methyltransferase n=1 Tax=Natronorarus salvus TaxID=3117733 RepID=UPI002F265195
MSSEDIQESYSRYAKWSDRFDRLNRLLTGRYRRRRFSNAKGRVLDVACGTGTNFRYLPESVELVGIDISEEMVGYARQELDRLDREGALFHMDAQSLEFESDSFDTVISSLSTCTFPDPITALQEMERVCSPTGRILLVEHGRSDVGLIARYQE